MKPHVMVDLETLGTGYRPAIFSIGAVEFSIRDFSLIGDPFYIAIDPVNAQECGFSIDAGTVRWWMEQSDQARRAAMCGMESVENALRAFAKWLPRESRIWGNGSNFDNRILREAYDLIGIKCPWHYRDDRDLRTFADMHPKVQLERGGVHHNALDDARFQVQCMQAMDAAKVQQRAKDLRTARETAAKMEQRNHEQALEDALGIDGQR